ncbi:MAG: transporter [Thermoanaerobaculia bacterium]
MGVTYAVTDRFNLSLGIPLIEASWSLPTPTSPLPPGPRAEQNASGMGDISLTGRYWMLPADRKHNVSLGLGIKVPTGSDDETDVYPNIDGSNAVEKPVDQSIQPGDGGWGILLDVQAFHQMRHVTLFGSGTYLANPKDTNDTPSILVGLGFGSNPTFEEEGILVNSVPDQYLLRLGAVAPFGSSGWAASLAGRLEGLPRYDLLGDSHGWRRPGYEIFAEPGLAYSKGAWTATLNVPIGLYRNRRPNPYSGREGDATFPDYIVLTALSYRF